MLEPIAKAAYQPSGRRVARNTIVTVQIQELNWMGSSSFIPGSNISCKTSNLM